MTTLFEDIGPQTEFGVAQEQNITRDLRKSFGERVKEMSEIQVWRGVAAIVFDWAVILGTAFLCELWLNPISYLIAVSVIAGRQHGLFALIHEATHFRLSSSARLNDFISDYGAAIPLFFDTNMYRLNHSKHHRFLNSDSDPDWVRKQGRPEWAFPVKMGFVLKTYPKFALFRGAVEWMTLSLIFSGILPLKSILKGHQRRQFVKRVIFFAVAATVLTITGLWGPFFMYWVIPLLFVFPSFQRVRSAAEHFGLKHEHDLNSSRNVLAPWYETMFFAPHSVNYHLVHHIFPAVPFYNLKRLNNLMMENENYRKLAHQNTSYIVPSKYPLTEDLLIQRLQASESNEDEARKAG